MASSLSSVPPVCPRPRPEIMGTATPQAAPSRLLRIMRTGLIEPFIASPSVLLSAEDRGTRARQAQGQVHSASAARSAARDLGETPTRHLALRSGRCLVGHRALDAPLP